MKERSVGAPTFNYRQTVLSLFFSATCPCPDPEAFAAHLAPLRKTDRVAYDKPPFNGPNAVLAYLSRHTHGVAISNHRLALSRLRKI